MTKKTTDPNGAWRRLFVGFDVSNEEYAKIRSLAAAAGKSVPGYVSECLYDKRVRVIPNRKMYEALKSYIGPLMGLLQIAENEENENEPQ